MSLKKNIFHRTFYLETSKSATISENLEKKKKKKEKDFKLGRINYL